MLLSMLYDDNGHLIYNPLKENLFFKLKIDRSRCSTILVLVAIN